MGMDQKENESLNSPETSEPAPSVLHGEVNRRQAIKYGLAGLAGLAGAGSLVYHFVRSAGSDGAVSVFRNDAPKGKLWELWQKRGWVREGYHYLSLGRNVQCQVCPNECVLEPEDRSHCRNKINKDGKLYTLAYGNPCAVHLDPIEKKPLLHFLPATGVFSIATSGCSFRCLNCQNWDISQKKPEETKEAGGEEVKLDLRRAQGLTREDMGRLSMFPEDVVDLAVQFKCRSIAYTYSEPTSFYEYMLDTARLARKKNIKNVWVTNGYINPEALQDLCHCLDAANVDLKSFSEKTYRTLNSGKLRPILNTLKTLKQHGVWFEVTNLIVPTYTDKLGMIERMCDWLVENVGPDYPLHFSRFHPQYKLDRLPETPLPVLLKARSIARTAGLHYVYVGNAPGVQDAETTFCPECGKAVVRRVIYRVDIQDRKDIAGGKCKFCGMEIAGVWSA